MSHLKKIFLTGGNPQVVPGVQDIIPVGAPAGAWDEDGRIVFSAWPLLGLWRVPATGGAPERLTGPDSEVRPVWYRRPYIFPSRPLVLLSTWTAGRARVEALVPQATQRPILIEAGSDASYARTGHLVYGWGNQILAAPFDPEKLSVGAPVPLVEGVRMLHGRPLATDYALSDNGTLVYVPGRRPERQLVWADRAGGLSPVTFPLRGYHFPALSPDGSRIAVGVSEGPSRDVWVGDLSSGTLSRLTSDGDAVFSLWSPDGKRVIFTSSEPGQYNIFQQAADRSGAAERLTQSKNAQHATSFSPDGRVLLFNEVDPVTRRDVWLLPLEGGRKPIPLVRTAAHELSATFSPDGRWVAYESNESGRYEIYIQAFAGPPERRPVSAQGGTAPKWNPNGRELFYISGDQLLSVPYEAKDTLRLGRPRLLFQAEMLRQAHGERFDYVATGERFLLVQDIGMESTPTHLHVVLNWFEELKRRVPVGQ